MELSNENIITRIIKDYDDVKIMKKFDEITLINFPRIDLSVKVNVNKFMSYLNALYLKPKGKFTKNEIIKIIKEKLDKIMNGSKNKAEKKEHAIDIFTFIFQFKNIMFELENDKFKITVFKKLKELFSDFNEDETDKIIYLYLSLYHVVWIKKNTPTLKKNTYKIDERNPNNIYEDSIDYYLDNI